MVVLALELVLVLVFNRCFVVAAAALHSAPDSTIGTGANASPSKSVRLSALLYLVAGLQIPKVKVILSCQGA